jgi:hypothetical protein
MHCTVLCDGSDGSCAGTSTGYTQRAWVLGVSRINVIVLKAQHYKDAPTAAVTGAALVYTLLPYAAPCSCGAAALTAPVPAATLAAAAHSTELMCAVLVAGSTACCCCCCCCCCCDRCAAVGSYCAFSCSRASGLSQAYSPCSPLVSCAGSCLYACSPTPSLFTASVASAAAAAVAAAAACQAWT